MRLTHNLASLNIYFEQSKILQKQSASLQRISSGYKVSSSKDNPDALAQSERFNMQIRGTQMASRNVQDGVGMLQTADGALSNMNDTLTRIRELVVQAGSGTNSSDDKASIQTEINQLIKGIDDISSNTEFNGVKLLGDTSVQSNDNPALNYMPIGANADEKVAIPSYDLNSSKLFDSNNNSLASIDVTQAGGTDGALKTIDDISAKLQSVSSKYGALENRFASTYDNLNEIGDKMQGAESSLRDADISQEMVEYSKDNILVEAGTALMAQTNKLPQEILSILDNVRK